MPKVTIEFDLDTERERLEQALKSSSYAMALWDIRQKIFRPARDHGYYDDKLKNLSDRDREVIDALEFKFDLILGQHDVTDGDL